MMKYFAFLLVLILTASFSIQDDSESTKVNWVSWEEAMVLNQKSPKKIFVDVYTEWCGWCKKMDATTFSDAKVAAHLNENFYCVKFDAEQREDVLIQNDTLRYDPNNGRRGVHNFAVALLNGKMSYPSYVYLDKDLKRITISPGYKEVNPFLEELSFISNEFYKTMTYQEFLDTQKK